MITIHLLLTNGYFLIHRYYLSTLEGRAGERHLFGVSVESYLNHSSSGSSSSSSSSGFFPSNTKCLTCGLDDDHCLFNSATFSSDASFYALECLGPGVPRIELRTAPDNQLCKYSSLLFPVMHYYLIDIEFPLLLVIHSVLTPLI